VATAGVSRQPDRQGSSGADAEIHYFDDHIDRINSSWRMDESRPYHEG
jgi:hypothetical protein